MAHSSPDIDGGAVQTSPPTSSVGEHHASPRDPREVVLPAFKPFVDKASLGVGYEDYVEVGGFWVAPKHEQRYDKLLVRYGTHPASGSPTLHVPYLVNQTNILLDVIASMRIRVPLLLMKRRCSIGGP